MLAQRRAPRLCGAHARRRRSGRSCTCLRYTRARGQGGAAWATRHVAPGCACSPAAAGCSRRRARTQARGVPSSARRAPVLRAEVRRERSAGTHHFETAARLVLMACRVKGGAPDWRSARQPAPVDVTHRASKRNAASRRAAHPEQRRTWVAGKRRASTAVRARAAKPTPRGRCAHSARARSAPRRVCSGCNT